MSIRQLRSPLLAVSAAVLVANAGPALGQSMSDPARRDILPSPPSVTGGSLGGFVNPAAWATGGGATFWWNDVSLKDHSLDNWGFSHGGGLGLSVQRRTFAGSGGAGRLWDYQLGFAAGDRTAHVGAAWRWSTGDSFRGHESGFALGSISRPNPAVAFGTSFFLSAESQYRDLVVGLGLRPVRGHSALSLFGDYSVTDADRPGDGIWSAGLEVRPARGVHLGGRVVDRGRSDDREYVVDFGLTLDALGLHVLPQYDDGDRGVTSYVVRGAPPHRGVPLGAWVRRLSGQRHWETIDLEHRIVTYQRDLWFDERRVAWIELSGRLRKIRDDPEVDGVLVNLAGVRIRPSLLWELRTELEACRQAGKTIAVHIDEMRIGGYYLASVADRVTMDPLGTVRIAGIAAHRTYMAGLLDKLGIGFEEHRYFEYKTAAEQFSRTTMSDPDREQLGRMIDVVYEMFRDGICERRGLSESDFDAIVEERGIILAGEARELGLVDHVGRWPDAKKWVEEQGMTVARGSRYPHRVYPDERWGRPPTLSLLYAQGLCAMDTGIHARGASKYLHRVAKRGDVAAVVLRADSPGGFPLPADLFSDGMRAVRESGKPVVVSQGDVAASGGYRISVDSDRVLTTPLTVTGSIGVISGWAWNDGFGDKTGFSSDGVQRGSHADLFAGIRLPIFGGPLPERNMTAGEKERARDLTMKLYSDFVGKVAEYRGLERNEVLAVAEGRVWMGEDAIARGLADEVGTLSDAIAAARERAGIGPSEEILVEEYPPRRRFSLASFPGPLSTLASRLPWIGDGRAEPEREDYAFEYVRSIASRPGSPLLLVPPEHLPQDWVDW